MKKILLATSLLVSLSMIASANAKNVKLLVGATPVPHAEILNFVKPILAAEGVDLEVKEFTDYVTPNIALESGDLDANYFQHIPYLNSFTESHSITDLVSVGSVHVEPLGLYSHKVKALKDLKDKGLIAIPNDPSNEARALILLADNGLITLRDKTNLKATPYDISKNPHKFKFKEIEAAQLPRVLDDVSAAIINSNFAIQAKLNPVKDSLLLESTASPYANIVVVKKIRKDDEAIKKLMKALHSDETRQYIQNKYKGSIAVAF